MSQKKLVEVSFPPFVVVVVAVVVVVVFVFVVDCWCFVVVGAL